MSSEKLGHSLGLVGTTADVCSRSVAPDLLHCAAMPANRVICVDAASLIAGHKTEPRIYTSRETTLHKEDISPLQIATPGSPPVVAAPTRSLLQTDAIAIKANLSVVWAICYQQREETFAAPHALSKRGLRFQAFK
jgi:hypothetical protein